MSATLIIKNLHVNVEDQEILTGLNLEVNKGDNRPLIQNCVS